MIQEIYPHKFSIEYKPDVKSEDGSPVLLFSGRKLLCHLDEEKNLSLPVLPLPLQEGTELSYVFALDGKAFFLAREAGEPEIEGFEYNDINLFRVAHPKELTFASVTAYHLSVWYSSNRFCGRCGSRTVHDKAERMMRCPDCGNMIFPKIMPSVIVGVINSDGKKLLLTRYNRPGANIGALVAGFTEIGETIEECVAREVMEETGLKVRDLHYYRSQPWGISGGGLLFGFWCRTDGSDDIHVDGVEIAEGCWFTKEELAGFYHDAGVSLTGEMITEFMKGENQDLLGYIEETNKM